jgi:small subunit ribosomal protein S3
MGQKTNPIGFRLAVNKEWRSKWYASRKEFPQFLSSDIKIRAYVKEKLRLAAVSKVIIERAWNSVRVTIHTARPGIVIGRKGAEIETMTNDISKLADGKAVKIDIVEIKNADLDAQLVAENIAMQIERRISFRRAMKKTIQITMEQGADGIRVRCAGRLGGAEISRAEWYREGKIPLHTLRTPIDYGFAEARTTYGIIGIKCWICKGDKANENREGGEPRRERRNDRGDRNDRGSGRGRRRENAPDAPAAAPAEAAVSAEPAV